jgi:hypothetical protein
VDSERERERENMAGALGLSFLSSIFINFIPSYPYSSVLEMEAVDCSEMYFSLSTRLHSITSQKKVIFIITIMRRSNLRLQQVYKFRSEDLNAMYFNLKAVPCCYWMQSV